jgi:hypothetical protein
MDPQAVGQHQEVWLEPGAPERSLWIELLEELSGDDLTRCVRAHFEDLAQSNKANSADVQSCADISHGTPNIAGAATAILSGVQHGVSQARAP